MAALGLGVGWRAELAFAIDRLPELGFVEVLAEHLNPRRLPPALVRLRERGVPVAVHGVSLSLGGAERLDRSRLRHLAALAERLEAPVVSEHVAFVRAGGLEAGHLLPVPRTRAMLDLLVRHVRELQSALGAAPALENIATLFDWPDDEMSEAAFLSALLERTDARLILDLSNLYANAVNAGSGALAALEGFPLERLAYVHVGGGLWRDGLYHDTHAHPVPEAIAALLAELARRVPLPGVLLERDDHFPAEHELAAELGRLRQAMKGVALERR